MFDLVVVAVAGSTGKSTAFTTDERESLAREVLADFNNVEVARFTGLMTAYARERDAQIIVRGLRAVSDFEYEFQMASMNRQLHAGAETVFLMPAEHLNYISSSLVREIAALEGDVSKFVHGVGERSVAQAFVLPRGRRLMGSGRAFPGLASFGGAQTGRSKSCE